jgi:hypothetical protein
MEEPAAEDTPRADPVLVALSSPDDMAIVLDAGSLKDSPVGRRLLACPSPEAMAELQRFEQRSGFRPLEQLERSGHRTRTDTCPWCGHGRRNRAHPRQGDVVLRPIPAKSSDARRLAQPLH